MPTQSVEPVSKCNIFHSQICLICDICHTNPAEGKSFRCVACTMQLNGEI